MKSVKVTRLLNGEVLVECSSAPDLRFRNQEEAHTWLATNGFIAVERRGRGDYISGTYVKPAA